jgi:glycosyltransferase involved in cell wall biosynthesis
METDLNNPKKKFEMTILFIADNIGGGGKERRMLELIKSLSKMPSYKIVLVSLTDMGVGYDYMYDFPVTIIETDRKHKFTTEPFFIIRNAIRKYKPDIVHSWGSMGSVYILPLLPFRKFKFINGIIADAPNHIDWYKKPYVRGQLTFPFSDVVLSNSLAGIKSYNAPVNKTFCIYNGIDMNRFKNLKDPDGLKQELGISHFSFIIGMVGAFHDRKDYNTFVIAAQKVIHMHKDICFLLVGEGKNSEPIAALLSDEDKKNIRFLGRRSDIESLIQIFDIGVLCTNSKIHGEGVSNSIIEYMSLGKPVIATEGGGTNEVIEDSKNGFLIEDKGVDTLVEKILLLYNNPETGKKMGEQALQTIKDKFLLDRMTDEFISIYKGNIKAEQPSLINEKKILVNNA